MKKKLLVIALLGIFIMPSCSTLTQMASLLTCQYNLQNVAQPKLAGISLTSAQDVTKLDAVSLARVATSLLAGSLPLSATVNLGVTNPNQTQASLAGLEWALFFEGVNMLSGTTTQQVSVAPNGGRSTVPFTVSMDLAKLFQKDNREGMLRFANGLLHLGEQNSTVTMKINPAVSFGGQVYKTGFIPISKTL